MAKVKRSTGKPRKLNGANVSVLPTVRAKDTPGRRFGQDTWSRPSDPSVAVPLISAALGCNEQASYHLLKMATGLVNELQRVECPPTQAMAIPILQMCLIAHRSQNDMSGLADIIGRLVPPLYDALGRLHDSSGESLSDFQKSEGVAVDVH